MLIISSVGFLAVSGASAETLPGINPPPPTSPQGLGEPGNPLPAPPAPPSEPEAPAVPTTLPAETGAPAPQAAPPETPQAPAAATGGLFDQPANSALTAAPPALDNDFSLATDLGAGTEKSRIDWSGYLRNETAFRWKAPRSLTKIRNTLYVRGDYAFNPTYKLTFAGWAYYDMVYDLYNYDTIAGRQVRNSDQPLAFIYAIGRDRDQKSLEARELYLDMHYSNVDVRLGRQFAVWGVLDGLRIVDEVQPQDFRELIMPDLLDYRIPTTMAKVDYYRKEGTYELIWQPEIRVNTPAPSGSEWELLQDVPGVKYPKQWDPLNANAGIRFSTNIWNTDVSFSYLYTYDDFPAVFRDIVLNQVNIAPLFFPQYNRIHMYGGTIVKQVGDYVVKGEMAYVTGKYFSVVNMDLDNNGILDHQGELKRSHLRYGVGLDFNWHGIDVSPSFSQWYIFNYNQYIVIHNLSTTLTLFLRKEIPQHSMLFECLAIGFPDLHEAYLNPRLTFFINDHFKITPGVNMFWGRKSQFGVLANVNGAPATLDQENQFIGNFSDNDRVYVNLTYSF